MTPAHRFAVAPMMDWTDRHCRVLHRLFTRRALVYTEMLTTGAVLHGRRERLLGFDPIEHPLALQLGGSDPGALAEAARVGAAWGYDEINLNVGCPSDRVQSGRFGACLMAEPGLVADCVGAMRTAVGLPVTVKCRLGIDDQDPEESLPRFAEAMRRAGAARLIVHARKAWLSGLSPRENREIPPLDHDAVYRLKRAMPDMTIILNGGIANLDAAEAHFAHVDGVMLGRAAYQGPGLLAAVDRRLFAAAQEDADPHAVVLHYADYIERMLEAGVPLIAMTRHLVGLFPGLPGARQWRRLLSEGATRRGADAGIVRAALSCLAPRDPAPRCAAVA